MDAIDLSVIERARAGDEEARTLLLKCAEPRVRTYIFRMTLDEHIRDDLSQETFLELVKALPHLTFEHTNHFWAWLYRTALSKIQRHYRVQGLKRLNIKSAGDKVQLLCRADQDPSSPDRLANRELCQAIMQAISALQLRHRSVLTLRCFDELSYPEIAAAMNISESQARLYFFRAKQSLKRHLRRSGFQKNHLLSALSAFATLTAFESQKASAAAGVTAASLQSAWTTALHGTLTSKAALGLAGLIAVSAVFLAGPEGSPPNVPGPAVPAQTTALIPDSRLSLIYDDPQGVYTKLDQISRTSHRAGQDWRHFVFYPSFEPVRLLKSPRDDTPGSLLVLGQGEWVEYELPRGIQDRPGSEISLYVFNWGALPDFFITDGQGQEQQILPTTYWGYYPDGPKVVGCDLSPSERPFLIRGIRIVGADNAGPYGGCGIGRPAVFLETLDPPLLRYGTSLGNK